MSRVAHIMQQGKKTNNFPQDMIFFDVETGQEKINDDSFKLPLKLGWAVYLRADKPHMAEDWFFFTKISEFWDWVTSKMRPGRRIWTFGHNINFDLTVMEWHHQLYTVREFECAKAILPDGAPIPFVVDWRAPLGPGDTANTKRQTLRLIDSANYFGLTSLAAIGKSIGEKKIDEVNYATEGDRWFNAQPGTEDWETLSRYCKQDVNVLKKAMLMFIEFVKQHDLGSFAISAAGQAMKAFQHKFMPKDSIYIHDHESAMKLERDSYMGARVELLYKQGYIEGPIIELDYNSMYPAIMAQTKIPCKLISYASGSKAKRTMNAQKILDVIEDGYGLVARVKVSIPRGHEPVVPIKHDGKLLYCTGTFDAVLTTPELKRVVERGYMTEIIEYALYEMRDDIFKDYVEFFYRKRWEYKDAQNGSFEAMCKLFLNSLYGKFGQYTFEWNKLDEDENWGVEAGTNMSVTDAQTGVTTKYRNIGGRFEIRSNQKIEPPNGSCVVASHIIAYGRVMISEGIEAAGGRENVVYCDTDSLHVINDGFERLVAAGMTHNKDLGKLKKETHKVADDGSWLPSDFGDYRAPKDYHLDGKGNKTKGIRKGSKEIAPGKFEVQQFRGFNGAFSDGDLNTMLVKNVVKSATGNYTKAHVDPDTKRITPHHLIDGVQEVLSELVDLGELVDLDTYREVAR